MRTLAGFQERYWKLDAAMREWHKIAPRPHRGHGDDHDLTVMMLVMKIEEDDRIAELASIAGRLHSIDRTLEKGDRLALKNKIVEMVRHLPLSVTYAERIDIIRSVEGHSNLNKDDDSPVQQALMDADRLANLMKTLPIRAGQFGSMIPAVEFEYIDSPNPASTYRNPCSVLDDILGCLSMLPGEVGFIEQLRLPKAKELGKKYHERLMRDVEEIREDYRFLGLAGVKL